MYRSSVLVSLSFALQYFLIRKFSENGTISYTLSRTVLCLRLLHHHQFLLCLWDYTVGRQVSIRKTLVIVIALSDRRWNVIWIIWWGRSTLPREWLIRSEINYISMHQSRNWYWPDKPISFWDWLGRAIDWLTADVRKGRPPRQFLVNYISNSKDSPLVTNELYITHLPQRR